MLMLNTADDGINKCIEVNCLLAVIV